MRWYKIKDDKMARWCGGANYKKGRTPSTGKIINKICFAPNIMFFVLRDCNGLYTCVLFCLYYHYSIPEYILSFGQHRCDLFQNSRTESTEQAVGKKN